MCCLLILSLVHHSPPGDAKSWARWELVAVRSGGGRWALLIAAVPRARLMGPKPRGAAGASLGGGLQIS